ncbi:Membrane fusion protein (MFP) family protein [Hyphomicrobiales bacterium]|nr:Membrane fusion protein (MFP) family protein [Hyphomicrobiales bacterium]CAH1668022.1 Membrane fusion protein (MFP) family protein [Hyphomicrobiales bacterium]
MKAASAAAASHLRRVSPPPPIRPVARVDERDVRDDLQLLRDLARLQGITDVTELARYIEPRQSHVQTECRRPGGVRPDDRATTRHTHPRQAGISPQTELDWRRPARIGLTILAIALGGGGAWATLAHLDGAAIAPGTVAVESRRKTVQHLEGGIVTSIHVRDGDRVARGQLLLGLDATQARASLDTIRNQRAAALAEEARLVAERDGTPITFPAEVLDRGAVPTVRQAIEDQRHALAEATGRFANHRASLEARLRQAEEQRAGSEQAHRAALKQLHWLDRELPALRRLYSRGLVQWPRITTLERQRAETEGAIGQAAAAMAQNAQTIRQAELELTQAEQQRQQQLTDRLIEIRKLLAGLREKLAVGEDVAARLSIRAPQAGVVQGLKVVTPGAVIKPGEALLDIAPIDEPLVIQARIDPRDMGTVVVGLKAEIQFPTFRAAGAPIFGTLRKLSHDSLVDETSGRSYFAAEIVANPRDIPSSISGKLRAGLPADVLIITGERTPLSYLLEPLTRRLAMTMREQ